MRTLTIANAKGGVGKTTLSVHLAAGLARQGKRVLLVDLDPQGNASTWLLGSTSAALRGIADALLAGRFAPEHLHEVPNRKGLVIAPATAGLAGADLALASEVAGETILRSALKGQASRFDYAILDCPPALGMTVLSAICASDGVVAPVLGAFLSLTGLQRLEETVQRIRERLNVSTQVLGYVLFAADGREAITSEAREILRQEAPDRLLKAEIRVSTAAKALPARQLTAWDDGADERGAHDYAAVIREVLSRLERGTVELQKRPA